MPYRIKSTSFLVRCLSAIAVILVWFPGVALTIIGSFWMFIHVDTQALLTFTEAKPIDPTSSSVTEFEFILIAGIVFLYQMLFNRAMTRFSRWLNKKMKREIEWEHSGMG